jgi:hypothetical protein
MAEHEHFDAGGSGDLADVLDRGMALKKVLFERGTVFDPGSPTFPVGRNLTVSAFRASVQRNTLSSRGSPIKAASAISA